MTEALVCWNCGASISDQPLPLSRVAGACREPIAEEVKDKERSNFCDYFKARADAGHKIKPMYTPFGVGMSAVRTSDGCL